MYIYCPLSVHLVSPDAIHEHVKTKVQPELKRLHYTAPEYAGILKPCLVCNIYMYMYMYNRGFFSEEGDSIVVQPLAKNIIIY